jgi:hypothetical protein
VSCSSLEMHSREVLWRWNTIRRCMFRALRLGHLVLSARPARINVASQWNANELRCWRWIDVARTRSHKSPSPIAIPHTFNVNSQGSFSG